MRDSMEKTLMNTVALVTGGTSGIGQAAAIALAQNGAKVVIGGRREKEGQDTVRIIETNGGTALFVKTDITSEQEVERLVKTTLDRFGRLDSAFNNAGIEGKAVLLHENTEKDYQELFDTNVKGVFFAMKYEIPALVQSGGGSIINNASILGHVGFSQFALYCGTKHAVIGITKAAALEYAKQKIRVNAVSPGGVMTDMIRRITDGNQEYIQEIEAEHPMGRLGQAQEIANAVVFLASPASSFITGQSLRIDGGFTSQ